MKVLLPISDELFGEALSRFTQKHNWPEDTEIKLISVVAPMQRQPGRTDEERETLFQNERLHFGRVLSRIQTRLMKRRPDLIVTYEVLVGAPAAEILSFAEKWCPSMIVMGSHGRTGIERLILGSVSFYIASHAQCSFTIVRIPETDVLDIDLDESDIPEEMTTYA
ncbi:MAG: universal stress protein [Candidatus Obscuribacterales bacterium]|nr:universal stress protein [Candidatus Obscuribacterales bacterium]